MKNVIIGVLGTRLDHGGLGNRRWKKWRPSLSMLLQKGIPIDEFILIHHVDDTKLAELTFKDMATVAPDTKLSSHIVDFKNAWDFEQVYAQLHDFTTQQNFDAEKVNYLVHITTGSHVVQICLYLLTEANYIPGKLLQTSPNQKGATEIERVTGKFQIINLDLSRYDLIASRFEQESRQAISYLKGGIATRNKAFNDLIVQLEQVSIRSTEPMLLTGPTGVGKSRLARLIYDLKKQRGDLRGKLVEVNCATLRGDNAMSAMFGHVKGAYTGATTGRTGLLLEADQGLLFLDEIGELGQDEQAMLLRAIEDKTFLPFGSDKESHSDFQLIAGTNRNLFEQVQKGLFREDLLARINLWTYEMPSLKQRIEDLKPNIDHELELYTQKAGYKVHFNKVAKEQYLDFSYSEQALWQANFRDLNSSIVRMATLASGGRITEAIVKAEIQRLMRDWQIYQQPTVQDKTLAIVESCLGEDGAKAIDLFEQVQLAEVIRICRESKSMAVAGRKLFTISRISKAKNNDSHRVRQYLQKYGLEFKSL
ncbi:MAG: RNA repair transcriptional activator RtcR [Thiotrichaceae bacterium]|nr:RNA repair transcriptional activator RtcR [Thiotrichaceae bacterium]